MTAKQLILELHKLPEDMQVFHVWDGMPRTKIEFVWLSRDETKIITSDCSESVYDDKDRPNFVLAGTKYWRTPGAREIDV
jgi:hypothetical protein